MHLLGEQVDFAALAAVDGAGLVLPAAEQGPGVLAVDHDQTAGAGARAVGRSEGRGGGKVAAGEIDADSAAIARAAVGLEQTALQYVAGRHRDAAAAQSVGKYPARQLHALGAQLDRSRGADLTLYVQDPVALNGEPAGQVQIAQHELVLAGTAVELDRLEGLATRTRQAGVIVRGVGIAGVKLASDIQLDKTASHEGHGYLVVGVVALEAQHTSEILELPQERVRGHQRAVLERL